jgi:hypothetical protein
MEAPVPKLGTRTGSLRRVHRLKWEQRLPWQYVIDSVKGRNSLHILLDLQSVKTAARVSVKALVDCGATRDFIDSEYVISRNLPVRRLSQPIPVLNMDGSPNQAGGITSMVDMVVDYKGHSERIQLAVTRLGKQHVILGYSWLQKHNPEINWETKEVRMTRCLTGCCTCRDELRAAWKNEKLAASILQQLREGPTPSICAVDSEEWSGDDGYDPADNNDLPDLTPDSEDYDDNGELEAGDRILYTVFAPAEEIRAGSTVSQCLTEAHVWNSALAGTEVPSWAADSRTSLPGSPLTLSWTGGCGIMPSNSSQMRNRPTARST